MNRLFTAILSAVVLCAVALVSWSPRATAGPDPGELELELAVAAASKLAPIADALVEITWVGGKTTLVPAEDYESPFLKIFGDNPGFPGSSGFAAMTEYPKPTKVVCGIDGGITGGECLTPWYDVGQPGYVVWASSCMPVGAGNCNIVCDFSTGAIRTVPIECGTVAFFKFVPSIGLLEVFEY